MSAQNFACLSFIQCLSNNSNFGNFRLIYQAIVHAGTVTSRPIVAVVKDCITDRSTGSIMRVHNTNMHTFVSICSNYVASCL